MPNPYHDSHNGRFSTAQAAGAAKDAIHDSGKSSGPEPFKSGDRVRNAHRHNDYGTVDGLEADGDVVVVKWDSGEWSQEDPTNLVTEVSARKHEAKQAAASALAQHVRSTRGIEPSLNEQVTRASMDASSAKHNDANIQAIASGNHKRQMAGLRGMGLAPTEANLAYVKHKHGIK